MRRPDPHAYHDMYGTWWAPADKHVLGPINPPYGRPKFPAISKREALLLGVAVLPLFAVGEVLRLVRRDYF